MPDTYHCRCTKVVDEETRIFRRFFFLHSSVGLVLLMIIGKLGELGSDETDRQHHLEGEGRSADVIHRSIGQTTRSPKTSTTSLLLWQMGHEFGNRIWLRRRVYVINMIYTAIYSRLDIMSVSSKSARFPLLRRLFHLHLAPLHLRHEPALWVVPVFSR